MLAFPSQNQLPFFLVTIYETQGGAQEANHIKKSQKTKIMFPHIQLVVFGFQLMLYI
jgi:hypothetical protein